MTLWKLVSTLRSWPVESQHQARRNALAASTALTRLRIEYDEIDACVEAAVKRHEVRTHRAQRAKLA